MLGVTLSQLLGQTEVSAFLKGVVAGGRFANAYLFHGPAGVGKCTAALAFARAMMCERAPGAASAAPDLFAAAADEPAGGGARSRRGGAMRGAAADPARDDACGACGSCVKSATLQHPDLRFLFPVSGEEKALENTVIEILEALRADPLFVFGYEKAASIRLSLTRDLLRELAYKPYEAVRRVVVVRDADRMREDQCSAMLKSIEEPGASTVWILTTARLARLPATIRSRCQRVRFAPLPEAMVRGFLQERADVPEDAARILAALCGGSLARALVLRNADPPAQVLRNQALGLLEPALRGDPAGLWKAAQGFMKFGRTGRESLRLMIEFHELWLRDLLRARYGAAPEDLIHRDREDEIRRVAAVTDATEIRRRLLVLEEVLRAIEGNVSPELALFSGLSRVAGARLGEGEWPRAATARWDY
jgi:DNA polymerase-3 subunit delta'